MTSYCCLFSWIHQIGEFVWRKKMEKKIKKIPQCKVWLIFENFETKLVIFFSITKLKNKQTNIDNDQVN